MSVRRLPYLPYLDGVRALAVLLVLCSHFPYVAGSAVSEELWKISQALRTGYIGVDLFFVLSGFLITRILLQERLATGTISIRNFYTNRALRIFPIYYLCVVIYALVYARHDGDLRTLATYTFNYYKPFHPDPVALEHTWSLSVEEQFYLAWPFVMSVISLRRGKVVTGILIPLVSFVIALVIAEFVESTAAANVIYMSVATRMMSLSLGACLAYGEAERDGSSLFPALGFMGLGVAILAADNIGRAAHVVAAGGFYWSGALMGYALLGFGAIKLLIGAEHPALDRVRSCLSIPPLRYLGRISYGLYLYHYLILFLLGLAPYQTEHTGTTLGRLATALIATFAAAHLSYRYLESPLLRLKNRPSPRIDSAKTVEITL